MPHTNTRRQITIAGKAKPKNTFENALAHLAITIGTEMHRARKTTGTGFIDIVTPDGSVRLALDLTFSRTPASHDVRQN